MLGIEIFLIVFLLLVLGGVVYGVARAELKHWMWQRWWDQRMKDDPRQ